MQNEMKRLADSNPAELVEGAPQGTIWWALNDAYAQAHGNKPEYVGRVRGVSKNILPVWGYIYSYYTPSQSRSQIATPPTIVSKMIERAIYEKEWQHKQEIEELLVKQREEINQQHKQQLDAVTAAITK